MFERQGVEAVEDLEIEEESDEGESEEDGDREPGAVEAGGEDGDEVAEREAPYDDAEGDENAELGCLFAADPGEVDLLWGHEGAEVADGAVDEGGEEQPADGCQSDDGRRGVGDEGDDGVDDDELDEGEQEAHEVFCEEDVAQAGGAEEVELDAGSVHAESVVGEDGGAEDGVGDGDGEDEAAEALAGGHAAGEEKDHEDGNDESVELIEVAAEVEELFFEAGDDGVVEAEGGAGRGVGGCIGGECCAAWRGFLRSTSSGMGARLVGLGGLAEVFTAELAMHAPGVDAEEESGEGDEAEQRGDGAGDAALAGGGDGGGGESGRKEGGDGLNEVVEDFEE